jgi:hypothetical protein
MRRLPGPARNCGGYCEQSEAAQEDTSRAINFPRATGKNGDEYGQVIGRDDPYGTIRFRVQREGATGGALPGFSKPMTIETRPMH